MNDVPKKRNLGRALKNLLYSELCRAPQYPVGLVQLLMLHAPNTDTIPKLSVVNDGSTYCSWVSMLKTGMV